MSMYFRVKRIYTTTNTVSITVAHYKIFKPKSHNFTLCVLCL